MVVDGKHGTLADQPIAVNAVALQAAQKQRPCQQGKIQPRRIAMVAIPCMPWRGISHDDLLRGIQLTIMMAIANNDIVVCKLTI